MSTLSCAQRLQSFCGPSAIASGDNFLPLQGIYNGAAGDVATPFCAPLPTECAINVQLDGAPGTGNSIVVALYDATTAADTDFSVTITGAATSGTADFSAMTLADGHSYCWRVNFPAGISVSYCSIGAIVR